MSRFYYKIRQLQLLQNEPFLLQNAAGITSRLLQNTAQH